jgi:hypothetical protein
MKKIGNCTNAGLAHKASCELIKQWVCQVMKNEGDFGKVFYDGKLRGYQGTKRAILVKGVPGVERKRQWVIFCHFCA